MPWSCHDHTMIMAKHGHDHVMMTAWQPCFLIWLSWLMEWLWYDYRVFTLGLETSSGNKKYRILCMLIFTLPHNDIDFRYFSVYDMMLMIRRISVFLAFRKLWRWRDSYIDVSLAFLKLSSEMWKTIFWNVTNENLSKIFFFHSALAHRKKLKSLRFNPTTVDS